MTVKRKFPIYIICIFFIILSTGSKTYGEKISWGDSSKDNRNLNITTDKKTKLTFETLTNRGDSTLIKIERNKKSKYILVDMGYYSGNSILKKLKNKKIKHIDFAIITHNDSDHAYGIDHLTGKAKKKVTIGKLYYNVIRSRYKCKKVSIGSSGSSNMYTWVRSERGRKVVKDAIRVRGAKEYGVNYIKNKKQKNFPIYVLEHSTLNKGKHDYKVVQGTLQRINLGIDDVELVIIPPISESFRDLMTNLEKSGSEKKSINNGSMAVVIKTRGNKVVFGGDYQYNAEKVLRNYDSCNKKNQNESGLCETGKYLIDSSDSAKNNPNSLYYGIKNYLFSTDDRQKVFYKVAHHGTGEERRKRDKDYKEIIEGENKKYFSEYHKNEHLFMKRIKPDYLIITGYMGSKGEWYKDLNQKYFKALYPDIPIYKTFNGTMWGFEAKN